MHDTTARPTAGDRPRTAACRCVVLGFQDDVRVGALLLGLARRGAWARTVLRPLEVMVELGQGAQVVIIEDADHRGDLGGLLGAIERFYPQVPCWSYAPDIAGPKGRLQRIQPGAATEAPGQRAAQARDLLRKGRETSGSPGPRAPDPEREDLEPDTASVLTAEELAMLLGPIEET